MISSRLRNTGLAVTGADQIFGVDYDALLQRVALWKCSDKFADECRLFDEGGRTGKAENYKHWFIKYNPERVYQADDPLMVCAKSENMRWIVEAGAHSPCKMISAEILHTPANAVKYKPQWSQNWHRDPEDSTIIKVFVYLTDVDEESGPFEYVQCSHISFFDLCPPGGYPGGAPGVEVDLSAIPRTLYAKVVGPAGRVIFCNTAGMHKGGHTKSKARTMAVFTWVPQGSQAKTLYRVEK